MDLRGGRLNIVQANTPWPESAIRRASVNSFGFGGANAHTILETPPEKLYVGSVNESAQYLSARDVHTSVAGHTNGFTFKRQYYLLPFSAHNEKTLKSNIAAITSQSDRWRVLDLAYTLGCRRSSFLTRSYIVSTEHELVSRTVDTTSLPITKASASPGSTISFVFTGKL